MNSRKADFLNVWKIVIIIGIFLATAWGYWFFFATINIYKTSNKVYVTKKEYLTGRFNTHGLENHEVTIRKRLINAEFDAPDLEYIAPGQKGLLSLKGRNRRKSKEILISVKEIKYFHEMSQGTIILEAELDASIPNPFEQGMGGIVKIIVDRITPAQIILQNPGSKTAQNSTGFQKAVK